MLGVRAIREKKSHHLLGRGASGFLSYATKTGEYVRLCVTARYKAGQQVHSVLWSFGFTRSMKAVFSQSIESWLEAAKQAVAAIWLGSVPYSAPIQNVEEILAELPGIRAGTPARQPLGGQKQAIQGERCRGAGLVCRFYSKAIRVRRYSKPYPD